MILKNVLEEILPDILPMIIIITVIVSSLRIAYIIKCNKKVSVYQELLYLIFIIYIMCLFHVVTFQDANYGTSNFVPFKEIFAYTIGSDKFFKNIIGNIIMFAPYGFFISYFLKNKKFSIVAILTLIVSITIECVQLYIGRVFDIDDVILNLMGGILGFLIFIGLDAISTRLPKFFRSDTFLNVLVIAIIVIMILYGFNINIFSIYS